MLVKYFLFTLLLICVTALFLILDGYLKTYHAFYHPQEASILQKKIEDQTLHNELAFGFVPDYTLELFDPFLCVSWTHLTHLAIMEIILISHCVKSQLARAIQTRTKIIYIEVLN